MASTGRFFMESESDAAHTIINPWAWNPLSDVTQNAKVITNLGRSSAVGLWKWPGLSEAGQGLKC